MLGRASWEDQGLALPPNQHPHIELEHNSQLQCGGTKVLPGGEADPEDEEFFILA